ncbi:DMT family transporter [Streptomyces sp. TE33382]
MNATLVAVALSLVSAAAYAAAAVAQSRLAGRTEPSAGVLRMLGRGAWWSAVGLNAAGALLHVAALKYGPLTLVQPLGALTLVAAVPLGARAAGRRVSRTEWRGTILTLIGLGALLMTAGGGAAPHETLSLPEALGVGAVTMAVVAGLSRPGTRPGLRHAAASGITSGVASALTQTLTVAVTDHTTGPLFSWRLLTVALLVSAFAMGGLLLSQTAYRGGLGAPLAVVTLANPVAAAAIGLALLGERLQGGAVSVVLALAGASAAVRGVILLSRAQDRPAPGAAGKDGTSVAVDGGPAPSRIVIGSPRKRRRPASARAARARARAPHAPGRGGAGLPPLDPSALDPLAVRTGGP